MSMIHLPYLALQRSCPLDVADAEHVPAACSQILCAGKAPHCAGPQPALQALAAGQADWMLRVCATVVPAAQLLVCPCMRQHRPLQVCTVHLGLGKFARPGVHRQQLPEGGAGVMFLQVARQSGDLISAHL